MIVIETERLLLRGWHPDDIEPFVKLNQDPRVMEFFPALLSCEQALELIRQIKQHIGKYGFGLWAAEIKATREFAGFIGLNKPDFEAEFTPCVEIGWRLAEKYWGHGYATEGAQEALKFAFRQLNLEEVVAFAVKDNQRSIRVMEKLGMKYQYNFLHPGLPKNHRFAEHTLYTINHL